MTCVDCRFWERLDLRTGPGSHYEDGALFYLRSDEGEAAADPATWGVCHRQDEPGAPMFTVDASEYYSSLSTRAEFSCSEFAEGSYPDGRVPQGE